MSRTSPGHFTLRIYYSMRTVAIGRSVLTAPRLHSTVALIATVNRAGWHTCRKAGVSKAKKKTCTKKADVQPDRVDGASSRADAAERVPGQTD